jgi:hypothetical protein
LSGCLTGPIRDGCRAVERVSWRWVRSCGGVSGQDVVIVGPQLGVRRHSTAPGMHVRQGVGGTLTDGSAGRPGRGCGPFRCRWPTPAAPRLRGPSGDPSRGAQRLPRRQRGRAAGRGLQPQCGEQRGEETADQAVAGEEIVEVGVYRGSGAGVDGLDSRGESLAGHGAPDRGPDRGPDRPSRPLAGSPTSPKQASGSRC